MDRVEVTGTHSGTIHLKQRLRAVHDDRARRQQRLHPQPRRPWRRSAASLPSRFQPLAALTSCSGRPSSRWCSRPIRTWKGAKPAFGEVRYILIDDNKAAELAFEADEIDVGLISSQTLARYRKTPPAGSATTVAGALQYMWLGMNTQHEKLKDIRVRQAIQHAVDVDFDPGRRLRGHHRARLWLRLPGPDRQALDHQDRLRPGEVQGAAGGGRRQRASSWSYARSTPRTGC